MVKAPRSEKARKAPSAAPEKAAADDGPAAAPVSPPDIGGGVGGQAPDIAADLGGEDRVGDGDIAAALKAAETIAAPELVSALGYDSIQELASYAQIGRSLMDVVAVVTAPGQVLEGWAPAEDPAEIVTDLLDMLEEQKKDTAHDTATPQSSLGGEAGALSAGSAVPPAEGLTTITVIGPARGRRRGGHAFGPDPQMVHVTAEELAAIEADGSLAVTRGGVAGSIFAPAGRLPIEAYLDEAGEPVAIKVLGPVHGRRRAGHSFGAEAVTIRPTREQLEIILGDADLSATPA